MANPLLSIKHSRLRPQQAPPLATVRPIAATLGPKAVGPLTGSVPPSARHVDVHRLLTEDSVDQRMLEILRVKADEFNEYARRSDLKDVTPDAVDFSDLAAAKEAATRAENERRIVEMERKRLRMEEAEKDAGDCWPSRTAAGRVRFPSPLFETDAASSGRETLAHEVLKTVSRCHSRNSRCGQSPLRSGSVITCLAFA